MNNDALVSALVKFQAWCEDNRALLNEIGDLEQQLDKADDMIHQIAKVLQSPAGEGVAVVEDALNLIDVYWESI